MTEPTWFAVACWPSGQQKSYVLDTYVCDSGRVVSTPGRTAKAHSSSRAGKEFFRNTSIKWELAQH